MKPAPGAAKPTIERDTPTSAVVNANQSPGMLAAVRAADLAASKVLAGTAGPIAMVTAYNTSTSSGQLAFYVERMAKQARSPQPNTGPLCSAVALMGCPCSSDALSPRASSASSLPSIPAVAPTLAAPVGLSWSSPRPELFRKPRSAGAVIEPSRGQFARVRRARKGRQACLRHQPMCVRLPAQGRRAARLRHGHLGDCAVWRAQQTPAHRAAHVAPPLTLLACAADESTGQGQHRPRRTYPEPQPSPGTDRQGQGGAAARGRGLRRRRRVHDGRC
jgi:hypothetical protein